VLATATVTALLLLAPLAAPAADDDDGTRAVSVEATTAGTWGALVPVVDRLDDGDVLAITVTDGVARSEGTVRQCTQTATGLDDCTNRFPVQFGDDGRARFQYRVADPGTCDGTAACVVVVGDAGGDRQAVVATVFGGAAPPPPTAVLASPGPYAPGQEVAVTVSDLHAGADVSAAFCAETCGVPRHAVAEPDGTATIAVTVGDRCRGCGVVVVSGAGAARVRVPFVPPPTVGYDMTRLVAGLAVAALALLLAWRTVVAVDWRPPSEAQVPDTDIG
jgi:hypothetical protein